MRMTLWSALAVGAATLALAGCAYRPPALHDWFERVETGMTRQDVVDILGEPTLTIENDLMYLYDDPNDPARFRFVLDEDGTVLEKYFETKSELAARAREAESTIPAFGPTEGEEPDRAYPGGPLPGFGSGG